MRCCQSMCQHAEGRVMAMSDHDGDDEGWVALLRRHYLHARAGGHLTEYDMAEHVSAAEEAQGRIEALLERIDVLEQRTEIAMEIDALIAATWADIDDLNEQSGRLEAMNKRVKAEHERLKAELEE